MNSEIVVALVGNPNCGKTSLFNALTGSRQHVGNWPGVTVEKKEGKLNFEGKKLRIVDLPGTYSLSAYSEDEVVARDFILKEKPDLVINVVDSTNLERNLYLTTQIMEMKTKVVIALNMMDESKKKGIDIDVSNLSKALKISVVPTVASKKQGIKELLKEVVKIAEDKKNVDYEIKYGEEIQKEIRNIELALKETTAALDYPTKWTAIKLLEEDEYIRNYLDKEGILDDLQGVIEKSVERATEILGYEPESAMVDKRYDYISKAVKGTVHKKEEFEENISDKIDKIVTNRFLGIPIFALIMFFMYQITMTIGNDLLGGYVGTGFENLRKWAEGSMSSVPELLRSFIAEGIIGGLGQVLTFVPLIMVMYLIISLLEDSGYMARAAYVMDRFMSSIGLHGKTAVSMIIGSGCNVAGIMATRTLESKKDRMIAILVNPFISCGARMPVYALFAGAFFGGKKLWIFSLSGIVIFSMYVIGIIMATLSAKLFSKTLFKGEKSYFVMELPPYRIPTFKSVFTHMWEKAGAFVKKAGTVIFAIVVIVWALSVFPTGVEPGSAESILGQLGSVIAPIFKPLGFGTWQAGVSLITGILAKESVIGTMATIYAVSEETLQTAIQSQFTALSAYSFMVFTLLYSPCMAALGTIRRETNSHKWAIFSMVYTTAIAWIVSFLIYNIGGLFIR